MSWLEEDATEGYFFVPVNHVLIMDCRRGGSTGVDGAPERLSEVHTFRWSFV
jgi:hypothetical protein